MNGHFFTLLHSCLYHRLEKDLPPADLFDNMEQSVSSGARALPLIALDVPTLSPKVSHHHAPKNAVSVLVLWYDANAARLLEGLPFVKPFQDAEVSSAESEMICK